MSQGAAVRGEHIVNKIQKLDRQQRKLQKERGSKCENDRMHDLKIVFLFWTAPSASKELLNARIDSLGHQIPSCPWFKMGTATCVSFV